MSKPPILSGKRVVQIFESLGWEDFLGQGVIVVEWAEKLDYEGKAIRVQIEITGEKERKINLSADPDVSLAIFP